MSLVSVIIADLFERDLPKTLDNVNATADGPIEIIVKKDDESEGMRHCLNEAAREAQGEFLFKLDGHCILTPHWDTILKTVCTDEKDMAVCRIREIDEPAWTMKDKGFSFVTVNQDLSIVACGDFVADDPDAAETMASIGCGFMLHRERFYELGGNWEELGRWGNLGVEWALKIWLSGGRLLVNRHVLCGHLFRRQGLSGGGPERHRMARLILGHRFVSMQSPQQIYPLQWLAERFGKIRTEKVAV